MSCIWPKSSLSAMPLLGSILQRLRDRGKARENMTVLMRINALLRGIDPEAAALGQMLQDRPG